ncbi:MAG: zinc ribbon domain-containing protein [Bryobacterales bacterium]|nr:zinc ribbon domain-containing protein [Bryobacterales bacterium]
MNSTCTCGAAFPDGSQFCPMCGRPLSEEAEQAERTQAQEALERARRQQAPDEKREKPIGLGNSDALRSSYFGALLAAFLSNMPFLYLLSFIWYPACGFLSVYIYRRKTGAKPKPSQGGRLGVLTGILTFAISLVISSVNMLFAGQGAFSDLFRQQIEQTPAQEEVKRQILQLIDNPVVLGFLLLISLIVTLVFTVGFSAAGGALGAKILEDE